MVYETQHHWPKLVMLCQMLLMISFATKIQVKTTSKFKLAMTNKRTSSRHCCLLFCFINVVYERYGGFEGGNNIAFVQRV
jgi:hypothetical protein